MGCFQSKTEFENELYTIKLEKIGKIINLHEIPPKYIKSHVTDSEVIRKSITKIESYDYF